MDQNQHMLMTVVEQRDIHAKLAAEIQTKIATETDDQILSFLRDVLGFERAFQVSAQRIIDALNADRRLSVTSLLSNGSPESTGEGGPRCNPFLSLS